ncbi:terminase small subunit, partial [Staphylococcus epidermidis]
MKLKLKQQTFVDEYIRTGNVYQSAIRAGYSQKYAKASSHKLLDNVGIKQAIDKRMAELKKKSIADQDE